MPFSFKIFILATSLATWVLFQCFTGDITSSMTSVSAPVLPRNFKELEDSDYTTLWVRKGTSQEANLRSIVKEKALHKLEAKIKNLKPELTRTADFIATDKGFAIYSSALGLGSNGGVKYLTQEFEDIVRTYLCVALRKNSELRPLFDYHILRLIQSGTLQNLRQRWVGWGTPEDASHRFFSPSSFALGFDNVFFPAMILLSGLGASLFSALFEDCWRSNMVSLALR